MEQGIHIKYYIPEGTPEKKQAFITTLRRLKFGGRTHAILSGETQQFFSTDVRINYKMGYFSLELTPHEDYTIDELRQAIELLQESDPAIKIIHT